MILPLLAALIVPLLLIGAVAFRNSKLYLLSMAASLAVVATKEPTLVRLPAPKVIPFWLITNTRPLALSVPLSVLGKELVTRFIATALELGCSKFIVSPFFDEKSFQLISSLLVF
jgi:hypothetical protein